MKIKLASDVYNISNRIKEIDKDYYIVYNTSKKQFEVHNSNQIGSSYCLALPYSELDNRTLNYVLKTRSSNIDKILAKIDNDNKLLQSSQKRAALESVYDAIERNIRR